MSLDIKIISLTKDKFAEAVELVLKSELDTREEIEHHLEHLDAHFIAVEGNKIVGVIGWYQDSVNYASLAMGDKFPGVGAFWVGFFTVDKKSRGKGIGYSLLKELEEVVKQKGESKLWVSSVPQTRGYYQKQNFKLVMEGKINNNPKFFLVKDL